MDPSATTRAYEIKPVPSSAAEGPEFVIGKNTNQRWPFHVGTSCLKVFTRPPPVRDDKGYVNILDFPGGTWDVESGDMSAAVDWRSPYYLIVEVLDASTAATGEEIRYGEHRGNGAASWYFGAGKYPNYCMERNGGTFWVNLFRTDGPKKPLSNPTVAAAWPLKNLIQENVQLSCSSSNTNVFAVPISDAGITGFGKAPQTVRKEFALEIGAIGYTTRYLRVQPDSSDNYTVISVEMAKDNHK